MSNIGTISLTHHVPFSPAITWKAITDPKVQAKWWAPGDVEPVVGHRFTLNMGAFGAQQCEVLAVEPEKLFSYTFGEGMLDTTITWRLIEADGGTDLAFEQTGFDLDSPMGQQAYAGMGGGWPMLLPKIEVALSESPESWTDEA